MSPIDISCIAQLFSLNLSYFYTDKKMSSDSKSVGPNIGLGMRSVQSDAKSEVSRQWGRREKLVLFIIIFFF